MSECTLRCANDDSPQGSVKVQYQEAHDDYAQAQQRGDQVGMQRALHEISQLSLQLHGTGTLTNATKG
ncbi:MAG: hypothetical protein ACRYG8_50925 [Janthinobacterium lividum]